ncbi:hypothetical protein Celaphus_00000451 [Cervus elaphus hippelaphus]|uniref:Uncharacterized protein n=1 Tax=Cervus elaphus hippelaphus TaxID=46360 RepID=A0A212D977_CEREH|nr:hypothetical protein Celaphus_00000451 [Cervus elaphus hippelaphus]
MWIASSAVPSEKLQEAKLCLANFRLPESRLPAVEWESVPEPGCGLSIVTAAASILVTEAGAGAGRRGSAAAPGASEFPPRPPIGQEPGGGGSPSAPLAVAAGRNRLSAEEARWGPGKRSAGRGAASRFACIQSGEAGTGARPGPARVCGSGRCGRRGVGLASSPPGSPGAQPALARGQYGFVNHALELLVIRNYGPEVWEDIK